MLWCVSRCGGCFSGLVWCICCGGFLDVTSTYKLITWHSDLHHTSTKYFVHWDNFLLWHFGHVTFFYCDILTQWHSNSVTAFYCDTSTIWHFLLWLSDSVTIFYCDTLTMWNFSTVTFRLCDHFLLWHFDHVTFFYCDIPTLWQVSTVRLWPCDIFLLWHSDSVIIFYCEIPSQSGWIVCPSQNVDGLSHCDIPTHCNFGQPMAVTFCPLRILISPIDTLLKFQQILTNDNLVTLSL
jgi:hypothetical protein